MALPGYVVNVALCPDLVGDKEARRDRTMEAAQGGLPRQSRDRQNLFLLWWLWAYSVGKGPFKICGRAKQIGHVKLV